MYVVHMEFMAKSRSNKQILENVTDCPCQIRFIFSRLDLIGANKQCAKFQPRIFVRFWDLVAGVGRSSDFTVKASAIQVNYEVP